MNPEPTPPAGNSASRVLPARHQNEAALGVGAMMLAAAPFLLPVITLFVRQPSFILDGDQAVDEMAEMRAEHFAQLVGNYSRSPGVSVAQAWSHPGPAWFYAMDPVYAISGSTSWGFAAAAILLQGVAAVLLVAVAWRRGGLWLAGVVSALVLLYVHVVGTPIFLAIWPPYATILPLALLLLLAAAGAAGSTPALVGALVAGSYLIQVHIATLATVVATLIVATVLRGLPWVLRRLRATAAAPVPEGDPGVGTITPLTRGGWALCAAGLFAVVAMWVPPFVDQVTSHPGNLTKLVTYFSTTRSGNPLHAALSSLARELEVFPLGHLPPPTASVGDLAPLSPLRAAVLILFVLVALGLALLGARLTDRFATGVGVLLVFAVPVITESLTRADGPLYPYFMDWASTLPLVLAVGWVELAVTSLRRLPGLTEWASGHRAPPALAVVVALATLGLCVADSISAESNLRSAAEIHYDASTPAAWRLTEAALAAYPPQRLDIDIVQNDQWTLSAGVMDQLVKRGWSVAVPSSWLFMFGNGAAETGMEKLELIVSDPTAPPPGAVGAHLIVEVPGTDIYLANLIPG